MHATVDGAPARNGTMHTVRCPAGNTSVRVALRPDVMVEQGWGRVINLSSWAWKSGGLTAGTAYSASKAAVIGLTFSLARQFAGGAFA